MAAAQENPRGAEDSCRHSSCHPNKALTEIIVSYEFLAHADNKQVPAANSAAK